ncbi:MAG: rhodanese-like domain-containing protein [Bacteroidota bacterium]
MKSIYTPAIILLFAMSLISCQGQESKQETTETPTKKEVKTAEGIIHRVGVADFNAAMTEDMQLVDVRTPKEFEEGHIETALNYDVNGSDFATQVKSLDKTKPVLLYCKKGGRSARAAKQLQGMGFMTIYDLEGGYTAWIQE